MSHHRIIEIPPIPSIKRAWLEQGSGVLPLEVEGTIEAEMNHGRWIVACPGLQCNGATYASVAQPWFICPDCESLDNGRRWRFVIFPSDKAGIEVALMARPDAANRNRYPGETMEDLRKENQLHGLDRA